MTLRGEKRVHSAQLLSLADPKNKRKEKKEVNRTIVLQQLLTLFVQLIGLINQSAVV